MKSIPSYRSAHMMPYLSFFKELGVPFEKYLRQSKLPTQIYGETELYLPLLPTTVFLSHIQLVQGIDDLPYRVLQNFRFTYLNEQFVSEALQSPTLLSALAKFSEYIKTEDNETRFWIDYGENTVKLCMRHSLPIGTYNSSYQEWSYIRILITFVETFLASDWTPKEIALRSMSALSPLSPFISEHYPNSRILGAQEANWITIPRNFLSLSPKHHRGKYNSQTLRAEVDRQPLLKPCILNIKVKESNEPFITSLKKILPAYLIDGYPSVNYIANMTGTSKRSLQRKLKQEGYNYTGLVQAVRFEFATDLLTQTDSKVSTIAYQLGYNDSAHFSRAFHHLAGISPKQYRHFHRA